MKSAKDVIQSILDASDGKTLEQSGVKGMKWGILRSRSAKYAHKLPATEDATKAAAYKQQARKQGIHTLSNDELKDLNKRLELEKKWNDYARANPTHKQRAAAFIVGELKKEVTAEIAKRVHEHAGTKPKEPIKGSPIISIVRALDTQRRAGALKKP